jgi:hypothetical protein
MSRVFVACAPEDVARVDKFVRALAKDGIDVWLDRGPPEGEAWRANVEAALNDAGCVIVVWTKASIGPDGGFARDAAARGKGRAVLVPVLFEHVHPPLGFGELHSFDLTHWRGDAQDPYLLDVVAAVHAKLDGTPVPAAKAPSARLLRRLTIGGAISAVIAIAVPFFSNAFNLQTQICTMPVGQPAVSDLCGAAGLGGRPTRAERIAWTAVPAGECEALRTHVSRFPEGAYRTQAAEMLEARKTWTTESWKRSERILPVYQGRDGASIPTEAAARAAALARAIPTAKHLCSDLAASGQFRVNSATPEAEAWACSSIGGGYVCGFQGRARCAVEERVVTEHESCGAKPR